MSNTTDIMADELKLAYPLTYDEIYNRGRADERARLLGILSPLGAMDSFEVDGKELKWGIRYAIESIKGGTLENVFKEQSNSDK